eukprot:GHRQ01013517.1.p1 GENE.GHRQ01013517.1~~GHRQ01013517.1.p1  ORF type:complete len:165 (+),score=7.62 GHRQ01013517.1:983-1477(+)
MSARLFQLANTTQRAPAVCVTRSIYAHKQPSQLAALLLLYSGWTRALLLVVLDAAVKSSCCRACRPVRQGIAAVVTITILPAAFDPNSAAPRSLLQRTRLALDIVNAHTPQRIARDSTRTSIMRGSGSSWQGPMLNQQSEFHESCREEHMVYAFNRKHVPAISM